MSEQRRYFQGYLVGLIRRKLTVLMIVSADVRVCRPTGLCAVGAGGWGRASAGGATDPATYTIRDMEFYYYVSTAVHHRTTTRMTLIFKHVDPTLIPFSALAPFAAAILQQWHDPTHLPSSSARGRRRELSTRADHVEDAIGEGARHFAPC